jgi:hypothetical protein
VSAAAQRRSRIARRGLGATLFVWAGVLAGVSFLAAPAKNLAPIISQPVALEIGREEFHLLNQVETAFALIALALAGVARPERALWLGVGVAAALVIAQGLWLLPVLDARAEMIIQGGTPPAAPWHALYVASEAVKVVALLWTGWIALPRPEAS